MQNLQNSLDPHSLLALTQFYENHEKRRAGETKERVLLKVVKDSNGKHLEWRVQNGPAWGWLDRLELIFTNHFKLRNVTDFLKNKQFGEHHAVIKAALENKIQKHNDRFFTRKITTVFANIITKPKAPSISLQKDELKTIEKFIDAMCMHSCKTQKEFEEAFERPLRDFESKGMEHEAVHLAREIFTAQKLQLDKPKLPAKPRTKELTREEIRATTREIDSRKKDHNARAASVYGAGLYNSGCDCFVNSIVQALRFSAIKIPELVSASPTLDRIRLLEEGDQNTLFEALIDVINIRNDRLQGLNQLKQDLVSKEKQPEFSKAVSAILALPQEQQDRALELILESFQKDPHQIDSFFKDPLIRAQKPLQTILQAIINSENKEDALAKFVDVVSSGIEKKGELSALIQRFDLEGIEPEIMRFAYIKTTDRQALIKPIVAEQLRYIHSEAKASKTVGGDSIQNLRQLLRLAGLDSESSHSQEDAALMCRTVCEIIGINPVNFNVKIDYQKLAGEIPVAALEMQGAQDNVVTLSIKDNYNDTPFANLINANTIKEEIDPKAVAETDAATMQMLLGRPLTDDEKGTLKNGRAYSQDTTQKLEFSMGSEIPSFLSFQVKRFEYLGGARPEKIFKKIGISDEIEIAVEGQEEKVKYDLKAVSVHSGSSPRAGHYYTYVRQIIDGKPAWIEYNDTRVIVHNQPDDIKKVELDIQLNGYVYFYSMPGSSAST